MKKLVILPLFVWMVSCGTEPTPTYTISTSATPTEGGSVSYAPTGSPQDEGTSITFTATPSQGYLFSEWQGDLSGPTNPASLTLSKNVSVTGVFEKRSYPLTITIVGEGTVKEEVIQSKTDYEHGTTVRLTAQPDTEWHIFSGWSGDITNTESTITLKVTSPIQITAKFSETSIIVNENLTRVEVPTTTHIEHIQGTFYNVSGPFWYKSDGEFYMFYPGNPNLSIFNPRPTSKSEVQAPPGLVLKRSDDKWEFHHIDEEITTWGARNFEVRGKYVVMGDGNEIGLDARDWQGHTYFGEIKQQGEIEWTRVTEEDEIGYFHGSAIGDLNKDGLLDVGGVPGRWDPNYGYSIQIFLQNTDGTFTNDPFFICRDVPPNYCDVPFTLAFADVMGDDRDEVILADYGGGDPFINDKLNRVWVYAYQDSSEKFELHFESDEPTAFYDVGMGATSIKVHDFDKDGIADISIAREDFTGNSFEIWKGNGDGTFEPHWSTPVWPENVMQFREFWVFDANNDGFLDILLRPFHFGNLYRNEPRMWNGYNVGNGIILNHLIWLNNGDGTFSHYDKEDLIVEGILVDNVHSYIDDGALRFVGTFTKDEGMLWGEKAINLTTYDIKVRLK